MQVTFFYLQTAKFRPKSFILMFIILQVVKHLGQNDPCTFLAMTAQYGNKLALPKTKLFSYTFLVRGKGEWSEQIIEHIQQKEKKYHLVRSQRQSHRGTILSKQQIRPPHRIVGMDDHNLLDLLLQAMALKSNENMRVLLHSMSIQSTLNMTKKLKYNATRRNI